MGGEYGYPSSWRLHRAHPALGLDELEGERLGTLRARDQGAAWLALEPAERQRRQADFVAALQAAARPGSAWEFEIVEEGALLGVRMDRWKSAALGRELLEHVRDRARRRDTVAAPKSARTLRAHGQVASSHVGYALTRRLGTTLAATVYVAARVAGWVL